VNFNRAKLDFWAGRTKEGRDYLIDENDREVSREYGPLKK
jgi:hypothetical protein